MPSNDVGSNVQNKIHNHVQKFRESLMMSKAELARRAGVSTLTIDRVESGRPCRLDTKRKILIALGMGVTDKDRVFGLLLNAPPTQRQHEHQHEQQHQQQHEHQQHQHQQQRQGSQAGDSNEFS